MEPAFRTIAIVGAGAVGTYYGARLGLSGADVRFLMRSDLNAVRERGAVLIREEAGTLELRPAAAFGSTQEIGPVDLAIVTLKATANAQLPKLLPPLLHAETSVLTLQNGLGSDEFIAGIVGARRVLGGLAFIASTRTAPGEVTCYHPGSITLGRFGGAPDARVYALADQFGSAGVTIRIANDLLEARWRKLIWNVPFNGLAVAHDLTTNYLCSEPILAEEVWLLMREVQNAAAEFGYTIPDEYLEQQFNVTPPMGAYQPSSLVDFRAGREVEIEAIWGEPLRRARAVGLQMPRLSDLYARLKEVTA